MIQGILTLISDVGDDGAVVATGNQWQPKSPCVHFCPPPPSRQTLSDACEWGGGVELGKAAQWHPAGLRRGSGASTWSKATITARSRRRRAWMVLSAQWTGIRA